MNEKFPVAKTIIHILIFLSLVAAVLVLLLHGEDCRQIITLLQTALPSYLLLAVLLALFFPLCEAINIKILLKAVHAPITWGKAIKYALIGFFFSSITPSATGGQPMQIYAMKKDGIGFFHSSIILLTELACIQIATLILGIMAFIWMHTTNLVAIPCYIQILITIGIAINICMITFLLLMIMSQKCAAKLIPLINTLLLKLPMLPLHKKQALSHAFSLQVEEYQHCSVLLKGNLLILVKVTLVFLIQYCCQFSISYVVYKALGQNTATFSQIFLLQVLIYMASFFLPFPGAVGINESLYRTLFVGVLPLGLVSPAMLLNRGISFYILLLSSGLGLVAIQIYHLTVNAHQQQKLPDTSGAVPKKHALGKNKQHQLRFKPPITTGKYVGVHSKQPQTK